MCAVQYRWTTANVAPPPPPPSPLSFHSQHFVGVISLSDSGGATSGHAQSTSTAATSAAVAATRTEGSSSVSTPLSSTSPPSSLSPSLTRDLSCDIHRSQKGALATNDHPSMSPLAQSTTTDQPRSRPSRPTLARLDTSERIKAYDAVSIAAAAVKARTSNHALKLNTECAGSQGSRTSSANPSSTTSSSCNSSLTGSGGGIGSGGGGGGGQTQAQSQGARGFVASEVAHTPLIAHAQGRQPIDVFGHTRRRESEPSDGGNGLCASETSFRAPISTTRALSLSSGALMTASFEVSEILDNFLFLGPEISTTSEATYLRDQLGIKRILNAAWEIESGGGRHLCLDDEEASGFKKYLKLPLKDTVEATGVQSFIEEACAFLDDARLRSAPTYVHCKAGKSRSVMLVMAYLIHANRWSLQRSYAYVVERRRDASPNIGFVAELMAFEQKRLKSDKPAGAHSSLRGGRRIALEPGHDLKESVSERTSPHAHRSRLIPSAPASPSLPRAYSHQDGALNDANIKNEIMTTEPFEGLEGVSTLSHSKAQSIDLYDIGSFREAHSTAMPLSSDVHDETGDHRLRRPSVDEKPVASLRRSTLATADTLNDFTSQARAMSLDDKA